MKQINLLPKSEQKELKLYFFTVLLWKFWTFLIISLILFWLTAFFAKSYLDLQGSGIAEEISTQKLVLRSSDNERLKSEVGDLNNQIARINSLTSQHYYWSKALAELANLLPRDVSVNILSLDRLSGKFTIQGTTATRASALQFWSDMHKSDYFRDINFPLTNLEKATDGSFSFTFFVNTEKLQ